MIVTKLKAILISMTFCGLVSDLLAEPPRVDLARFAGKGQGEFSTKLRYEATYDAERAVDQLQGTFQKEVLVNLPDDFEIRNYRWSVSEISQYPDPEPPHGYFLILEDVHHGRKESYSLMAGSAGDELTFVRPTDRTPSGREGRSFDYVSLARRADGTISIGTGGGLVWCPDEDGRYRPCGSGGFSPESFLMEVMP